MHFNAFGRVRVLPCVQGKKADADSTGDIGEEHRAVLPEVPEPDCGRYSARRGSRARDDRRAGELNRCPIRTPLAAHPPQSEGRIWAARYRRLEKNFIEDST